MLSMIAKPWQQHDSRSFIHPYTRTAQDSLRCRRNINIPAFNDLEGILKVIHNFIDSNNKNIFYDIRALVTIRKIIELIATKIISKGKVNKPGNL